MPTNHALVQPATRVGAATFQGKLYSLGDYPGAVPSTNTEDRVQGEVYALHEPEVTLPRLDAYEGCAAEQPPPHDFERTRGAVLLETGEVVEAQMYLYTRGIEALPRIQGGDFLAFLRSRRGEARAR